MAVARIVHYSKEVWRGKLESMLKKGSIPTELMAELWNMHYRNDNAQTLVQAIVGLLNSLEPYDLESWILMMRLINAINFYHEDIKETLLHRFFKHCPLAGEARAHVMDTLLNMKHLFYPVNIKQEFELYKACPETWHRMWNTVKDFADPRCNLAKVS